MTLAEHPELFARIDEDPFDDGRWSVLEDWLLETGDPRGEIVKLEKANKRTQAALAKLWPDLAKLDAQWRAGFVTSLVLDDEVDLTSPALRFVREIDIAFVERRRLMQALVAIAKLPCMRVVRLQGEIVPSRDELELPKSWELLRAAFELENAVSGVVTRQYAQVGGLVGALDAIGIDLTRRFLPSVVDLVDAVVVRKEIELHRAALEVARMALRVPRSYDADEAARGLRDVIEYLFEDVYEASPWAAGVLYRIELSLLRPRSRPRPARSPRGPRPSRPSRPRGSR